MRPALHRKVKLKVNIKAIYGEFQYLPSIKILRQRTKFQEKSIECSSKDLKGDFQEAVLKDKPFRMMSCRIKKKNITISSSFSFKRLYRDVFVKLGPRQEPAKVVMFWLKFW